jgi:fucose 4-O-acetylase-like acetyltransferase
MENTTLSPFVSQKMRFYGFLAMFFLVFVHGYNLQDNYLQPWTLVSEPLRFTTFFEYLTANGLLRFRIPMLFIISGYLYALTDYKPYKERTLKRLRTLGLPFVLWSLIALLITLTLEFSPVFLEAIRQTHLAQISDKTFLVSQYTFQEWLIRIFLAPICFQFWFIQALLFYNLAYPLLRWLVVKNRWILRIWFGLAILMWLVSFSEGLLFFTLGIWLQKSNFNIETAKRGLPTLFLILFVLFAFLKTYLAFLPTSTFQSADKALIPFFQSLGMLQKSEELVYYWGFVQAFMVGILFKMTELTGLIGIWYGCNGLVRWAQKIWFVQKGQDFSFFIFALHVPILYYVMYLANVWSATYPYHRLATFLIVPLCITLFCMLVGAIIRKASPTLYGLLTGGRGKQ